MRWWHILCVPSAQIWDICVIAQILCASTWSCCLWKVCVTWAGAWKNERRTGKGRTGWKEGAYRISVYLCNDVTVAACMAKRVNRLTLACGYIYIYIYIYIWMWRCNLCLVLIYPHKCPMYLDTNSIHEVQSSFYSRSGWVTPAGGSTWIHMHT